jgi:hypothetical protein
MLNVVMLGVIMLTLIMLSFVALFNSHNKSFLMVQLKLLIAYFA